MSCIIGLIDKGHVYMGADGCASTDEGSLRPIVTRKIIRNGKYLIGYTGSIRTGQIIDSHYFKPPNKIKDLPEVLREHLYTKGCVATIDGGISMQSCNFLISYKKKLYEILTDFQLNELLGNFTAIGSGSSTAIGAMYVLNKVKLDPYEKIKIALNAASLYHGNCGPPFEYAKD